MASLGTVRCGEACKAGMAWHGRARLGKAWLGKARLGERGAVSLSIKKHKER